MFLFWRNILYLKHTSNIPLVLGFSLDLTESLSGSRLGSGRRKSRRLGSSKELSLSLTELGCEARTRPEVALGEDTGLAEGL